MVAKLIEHILQVGDEGGPHVLGVEWPPGDMDMVVWDEFATQHSAPGAAREGQAYVHERREMHRVIALRAH